MDLFRFIFSFLYTRNWESGEMELSHPRAMVFLSMLSLILLGVVLAALLQLPATYIAAVE